MRKGERGQGIYWPTEKALTLLGVEELAEEARRLPPTQAAERLEHGGPPVPNDAWSPPVPGRWCVGFWPRLHDWHDWHEDYLECARCGARLYHVDRG